MKPSHPPALGALLKPYLQALLALVAAAAASFALRGVLDLANIVMLFLLAVFLTAVWFGRGPSLLAAFLAVGLFDFFFVPPHLSFAVSDAQYLVTFAVMLAVGLVTTQLVAGIQAQRELAQRREEESRELYRMASALAGATAIPQAAEIVQRFLADTRALDSALFLADAQGALPLAVSTTAHPPGAIEAGFARTALERGEVVEIDALAGTGMAAAYVPLSTSWHKHGVLAVSPRGDDTQEFRALRPLLTTVASLVAIAIERLRLVEETQDSQVEILSERLRNSILSALSHDLRTPLTALVAMADTLLRSRVPLAPAQADAAQAIRTQAQAMSQMLGNLLDMARLQAGRVSLRKEWQAVEEVVGSSIHLLAGALAERKVSVVLPEDLPLVEFDAVLLERVLCNLLENAAKYSPAGRPIEVSGRIEAGALRLSVCDRGSGFSAEALRGAFEKFYRGQAESATSGVGLGLAICKAIIDAHGGSIEARNREDGGACVGFTLPLGTPPAIEEEVSS